MLFDGVPPRALLAVLPTPETAHHTADRLRRAGVDEAGIRIAEPRDTTSALEAEVQEEVSEAVAVAPAGVTYPKETAKAGLALGPPLVAVGAVLGAVLAALVGPETWGLWLRILVGGITGGVMASAIAAVIVPAMSVKNPQDPSAAAAAVTLRVEPWSEEVERILVESTPRRLDRLGEADAPLGTVITEEQTKEGGIVEEVAENFDREIRAEPRHKTR